MKTGSQAVGSAGPSAPSKGAGELAGLLAEVKSMTPEHLRKIEAQVAEFHSAQEASEKAQADAEEAQHKAALALQDLGKREHEHNGRMERDLENLDRREVNVKLREDNIKVRASDVQAREQIVSDAERRIALVRENIDSVGDTAA